MQRAVWVYKEQIMPDTLDCAFEGSKKLRDGNDGRDTVGSNVTAVWSPSEASSPNARTECWEA